MALTEMTRGTRGVFAAQDTERERERCTPRPSTFPAFSRVFFQISGETGEKRRLGWELRPGFWFICLDAFVLFDDLLDRGSFCIDHPCPEVKMRKGGCSHRGPRSTADCREAPKRLICVVAEIRPGLGRASLIFTRLELASSLGPVPAILFKTPHRLQFTRPFEIASQFVLASPVRCRLDVRLSSLPWVPRVPYASSLVASGFGTDPTAWLGFSTCSTL